MRYAALTLSVLSLVAVTGCRSNDPAPEPSGDSVAAIEGAAAAVDEDGTAAMMEAYAAAGLPGAHHAHLAVFVGEWTARMTAWMDPSAEPMVLEGVMTNRMDLDGRFLRQTYHGDMLGTPYEGRGYMGYNNVQQRYESVWMGSTDSNLSFSTGSCSEDGRTFTMHTTETNAMSGETLDVVDVLVWHDADRHTLTRYHVVPGGEDVKSFEIVYERKG